jgi:hypothetical protein
MKNVLGRPSALKTQRGAGLCCGQHGGCHGTCAGGDGRTFEKATTARAFVFSHFVFSVIKVLFGMK